jgi:glycosyltransferase involved in cell wall biosynthesis
MFETLPKPLLEKLDWPWTAPSDLNSKRQVTTWPRISIITPSYNQGHFIEETIRSVLLQDYPNLEFIIIDGGSDDNTCEIIKRYESWITYWVSEADEGQTHAINKGLKKSTGDIIAYLNSDDYYLPKTLFKVAEAFIKFPQTDLLHGKCRYVNDKGHKIGEQLGNIQTVEEILDLWGVWWNGRQFVQPEVFWSKRITDKVGAFNADLHYVMDFDYWCRIIMTNGVVTTICDELSCFRFTNQQKSNDSRKVADELRRVVQPLLWNNSTSISEKKQTMLQAMWLYDTVLLNAIEISVCKKENTIKRWVRTVGIICKHPKILLAPSLKERFYATIRAFFLPKVDLL